MRAQNNIFSALSRKFFKLLMKILERLNIIEQCRKNELPLYQCPQVVFVVMGIVIIGTMVLTYAIGTKWIDDPETVALIISIITSVLLILSFAITQSFERISEASRMKTEFINVVSHQLRSPLTNLKWATDFLKTETSKKLNSSEAEYFTVLEENCARMNQLVNDLLTVSRIEQKQLKESRETVSLPKLLKKIVNETNAFAIASNVKIKTKIDEKIPEISCTNSHVKTVFENLINNAIRYCSIDDSDSKKHQGLVEIKLNTKNNKIYFEIKDNGVGIPVEDQKFIFQKFFRAKNILKHQTQGSGLGLFIVKAIIEKMGGKVGFMSKIDKGATFWLGGKVGFMSKIDKGATFWFTLPIKT
jgi:signal transduction histidine kinase